MTAQQLLRQLRALGNRQLAQSALRFFKTPPDDVFVGIRAATLHALSKQHANLELPAVQTLLNSNFHEARLLALLILVRQSSQGDDISRKQIFKLYLAHTQYVNNWDLVDASAPQLVGAYLMDKKRQPLYRLAKSGVLWERRIAVVATQYFIRHDDFADTLKISRLLLADSEDLIHKAAGWMLREVGKRDTKPLETFLQQHAAIMPRTMLRYAIERLPEAKRRAYLSRS